MRIVGVCWLLLALSNMALPAMAAAPFAIGGDPSVNPDHFVVSTFASGLDFPTGITVLQDNSLLAGINHGTSFFSATGEVVRFEDVDGDGIADGPGVSLFAGFAGFILSVDRASELIFVSVGGSQPIIYVLRQGATPAAALTLAGQFDITFPSSWLHGFTDITARDAPGQPGKAELYFNIGSEFNFTDTLQTATLSGLVSGTANADSLYRVIIDDTGASLTATGLEQIAAGLRNAFGAAFDPSTGDLYLQDNGIDGLVEPAEAHSADELNRIAAADIGGAVEDFGFADRYVEYRTGNLVGSGGIDPVIAFQPVPSPNGAESEGAVDVVFAPPGFPIGLRDGVFIGFHGQFNLGGAANEENPVVYADVGTGSYFHFIANDEPGIGHPNNFAAVSDILYLADMSTVGSLGSSGSGSIFRIRYDPAQDVPGLTVEGFALVAGLIMCGSVLAFRRRLD